MLENKVLLSLGFLLASIGLTVSSTDTGNSNSTRGSVLVGANLTDPNALDIHANILIEKLIQMEDRIIQLEKKVQQHEMHIRSLDSDIQFFNPTVEHGYIDMNVVNWEEAVENGLHEDVSVTFNAGQSIGAFSTWTFYLSLENNNETLSVDLALQQEAYNKGVLYVGFTVFVLDSEDNIAFTKHSQPRDILATARKVLHLSDVVSLSKISNPDFKLLKTGTFRLRFKIDLLGAGKKLHAPEHTSNHAAKDTQTVLFEVENLPQKLSTQNSSTSNINDTLHSIAFTRFQLKHPWGEDTNWEVILKSDKITKFLTLFIGLDEVNESSGQVFATFKLKLMLKDSKDLILSRETPLHDYNGKGIFLELVSTDELTEIMQDAQEDAVEFKLYVSVFGRNARYYVHI